MPRFDIRIPRVPRLSDAPKVRSLLERLVARASGTALRTARLLAPRDLGAAGLAGSIQEIVRGPLDREVAPGKSYAVWVELGRPAEERMPPPKALVGWVKRHPAVIAKVLGTSRRRARGASASVIKGVAFVVARAIGRHGIPPRPFMAPAAAAAQAEIDRGIASLVVP